MIAWIITHISDVSEYSLVPMLIKLPADNQWCVDVMYACYTDKAQALFYQWLASIP